MTARLVAAVEAAIAHLVQEFEKEASVVVQFPAGVIHEVRAALAEAKAPEPVVDAPLETTKLPVLTTTDVAALTTAQVGALPSAPIQDPLI